MPLYCDINLDAESIATLEVFLKKQFDILGNAIIDFITES